MEKYNTLTELDGDIALCNLEIWRVLNKYKFSRTLCAQILSEQAFHLLSEENQPERDKLIKNDLNNK